MLAKFTQCIDLPAREIERRIAKYFDLEPAQVHAKYIGRIMPTQEGEKIVEIRVDEPALSNEELLRAMGIIEGDRMTWTTDGTAKSLSENLARKEPAMAEKQNDVQQQQMNQLIETMKSLFGLDKIVEWLKAQVQALLDEVKRVVAEYKVKVADQDARLAAIEEKEQKAAETAQLRATANDESLTKLRNDLKAAISEIASLKARLNAAAEAGEVMAKKMKG